VSLSVCVLMRRSLWYELEEVWHIMILILARSSDRLCFHSTRKGNTGLATTPRACMGAVAARARFASVSAVTAAAAAHCCSLLRPAGPPAASPRCLVARAPRALARARATRARLKCFAFAAPGSGSPGSPGCVGLADSTRCAHTHRCYHLQRAASPDAAACLRLGLPPARLRSCHAAAVARALRASACYREAGRCGVRTPPHRLPRRG
jgi:hypothetical protein